MGNFSYNDCREFTNEYVTEKILDSDIQIA